MKLRTICVLVDAGSFKAAALGSLQKALRPYGVRLTARHSLRRLPRADALLAFGFTQMIPARLRRRYRHTLVIHESGLPKGRGWSPLSWQILEGKKTIPITLFEAEDAVDSGVIYASTTLRLDGTELVEEWRAKAVAAAERLLCAWVRKYPASAKGRRQRGAATFYPRRGPRDNRLDPRKSIATQFNLLRIADPDRYPCYFDWRGARYRVRIEKEAP